jgi:hypothetical protein
MSSQTKDDKADYSEYSDIVIDLVPSRGRRLNLVDFNFRDKLKPGDQIAVGFFKFERTVIAYHHGIYIGKENVIDMNDNAGEPSIQQRSLESFVNIGDVDRSVIILVEYENDSDEKLIATISFANVLMNSSANEQKNLYNIFMFNCEAFATYCRTGNLRYNNEIKLICTDLILPAHSNKNMRIGPNKLKR